MKKVYLQRALKLVALIVPIVLVVLFLQSYVFVFCDANTERIQRFYCEEPNSLDVVFLGASEITAGYAPGYAYGKYGYTSYMYSMDGNTGSLYTAQLKEILAHQKPELIFVEIFGFTQPIEALNDEAKLRYFAENIPNSPNKFETIRRFHYDNKISCLFPFIKYHGDFDVAAGQLSYLYQNYDSIGSPLLLKGMTTQTVIHTGPGDEDVLNGSNDRLNDHSEAYLVEFLEFCRQQNLDNLVFVNFPRYFEYEDRSDLLSRVRHIQQIVSEHGFEFLDLQPQSEQIGIDIHHDYYNCHHLNVYGQVKLTDHLGKLIIDQYGLTPREQSAENKAHWEASAKATDQYLDLARKEIAAGNEIYLLSEADILQLIGQP